MKRFSFVCLVLGFLFTLFGPFIQPAQNPCVSNPLKVTNVRLPTSSTGNKEIAYTTSSTQSLASFNFTAPNVIVFTDTRGCTQTIRK